MCVKFEKATWIEDHWEFEPIVFEETEDVPFPTVGTDRWSTH